MTTIVGIRDLVRNSSILDMYDYVEVEDKRTKKLKGLFISPKYADEFIKYIEEKKAKQKQQKIDEIEKFAGNIEIETKFKNLPYKKIKSEILKEKYGR